MRKKISIFLMLVFLISLFNINYASGISFEDDFIDIKLTSPIKDKNSINLYSEEGFSIYSKDDLFVEIENLNTNYINIKLSNGELIVSNDYEELFSLEEFEDIVIGSANGYNSTFKIEDNNYRGYIYFNTNGNEIIPINHVKLEEYLYGVVPREMPASFNMEALKAQAIAARTYALHNINKHSNEGFNLCDTTHCQVYGGMDGEHENTNRAVDETYGMVIEYDGEIIDAIYHSNSGGHTRDAKEVWNNDLPYLIGVEDKYSEGTTASNWSFSIDSLELNKELINNGINTGHILDIQVVERTPSGRVTKMKVIGQNGEEILTESQIRQVLGTNNLKTTWFMIESEGGNEKKYFYVMDSNSQSPKPINLDNSYIIDDNFKSGIISANKINIIDKDKINAIDNQSNFENGDFVINGKGFGHGVGMSQWGAKAMADAGYTYEEILKFYYTDIDINSIY